MIYSLLALIVERLNRFIADKKGVEGNYVIAANINNSIQRKTIVDDKIIVSIINIEEDATFRQTANYVAQKTESNKYAHPPLAFKVNCLFTLYTQNTGDYASIDLLTYVIEYFHLNPRSYPTEANNELSNAATSVPIIADWISMDVTQTKNLWSMFGNEYHPSVVYQFKNLSL